jgi:hypothetical protein
MDSLCSVWSPQSFVRCFCIFRIARLRRLSALLPNDPNHSVTGRQVPRDGPCDEREDEPLGIFTEMDMRNQTLEFMNARFGTAGACHYWISRGVDERPVRANRIRKSVGAENTFSSDLH